MIERLVNVELRRRVGFGLLKATYALDRPVFPRYENNTISWRGYYSSVFRRSIIYLWKIIMMNRMFSISFIHQIYKALWRQRLCNRRLSKFDLIEELEREAFCGLSEKRIRTESDDNEMEEEMRWVIEISADPWWKFYCINGDRGTPHYRIQ